MKKPINVTVTGATGQIAYSLLFRIAAGCMFGADQAVNLPLLGRVGSNNAALAGTMMELEDCAFPLLWNITDTTDPMVGFRDADVALLVGARPRGPGMERSDLLQANAAIFQTQGKALNEVASRDVKWLVVGNPCNTNAWIAMKNAPDLKPENFSALMRLDQNRAEAQLAKRLQVRTTDLAQVAVWGNQSHSRAADVTFKTACG